MKCAEFHQALPQVLEEGAGREEAEHLRSCPDCSGLAQDLKSIAQQASLLSADQDPHPRVWQRIREAAELEGLIRPARPAADPPPAWVFPSLAWASPARLAAALVLLLVLSGALLYRNVGPRSPAVATSVAPAPAPTPAMDANDQTVLASVEGREPEVRARYERNLRNVNAYIRDAQQNVDANPYDEDARDTLRHAYEQKAMLYEMAMSHSMQ